MMAQALEWTSRSIFATWLTARCREGPPCWTSVEGDGDCAGCWVDVVDLGCVGCEERLVRVVAE
jgi:hypothetical protein